MLESQTYWAKFRNATQWLMQQRQNEKEQSNNEAGPIVAMPTPTRKWHSVIDDAIGKVKCV